MWDRSNLLFTVISIICLLTCGHFCGSGVIWVVFVNLGFVFDERFILFLSSEVTKC